MKNQTARTLTVFSGICIVVGLSAHSPSLILFLMVLAAAAAAAPAILAPRPFSLWGMALLALSILLVFTFFDDFKTDQQRYRKKSGAASHLQAPSPVSNISSMKGGGRR